MTRDLRYLVWAKIVIWSELALSFLALAGLGLAGVIALDYVLVGLSLIAFCVFLIMIALPPG